MAKLYLVCDSLCVTFLIFFNISLSFSAQISDYYYHTDVRPFSSNSYISINLEDGVYHSVQKRGVIPPTGESFTVEPPSSVKVTTPKIYSTAETSSPNDANKVVSPIVPTNATIIQRNLGENGTGIRKNFTTDATTVRSVVIIPSVTPTVPVAFPADNKSATASINQSNDDVNRVSIANFPADNDELNKTLQLNNITKQQLDSHTYYNSTFTISPEVGQHYWMNLSNRSDVKINELLSKSHRRATTIKLSFDFPFYGHTVRNVTIATGGFLYTGDYVHSWLAATQYIAPLMANFDTSISNDSFIKYVDNGTAFTVQWEKVSLQDKPLEGQFTFQATLHSNGDIVFVYRTIPVVIEAIQDDHHPVKIGLSDAYIIDRTIFFVRRKTIYEYHRINFDKEDIKNWTVIYLRALPTCLDSKDCNACLTKEIPSFDCKWCPSTKRCSNGLDRHRQDWLTKGCDEKQIFNETECSLVDHDETFDGHNVAYHTDGHGITDDPTQASRIAPGSTFTISEKPDKMSVSGVVAILFTVASVACVGVWIMYAYRNPHTTSGQILIRYRPSQWRWKRGEARYTAATIHM